MVNMREFCLQSLSGASPYSAQPAPTRGVDPAEAFVNQYYGQPFGRPASAQSQNCLDYCSDVLTTTGDVPPQNYGLSDPAAQCR